MTEFKDPCPASAIYVERASCPCCDRTVAVVGDGRYEPHSRTVADDEPLQSRSEILEGARRSVPDFGAAVNG